MEPHNVPEMTSDYCSLLCVADCEELCIMKRFSHSEPGKSQEWRDDDDVGVTKGRESGLLAKRGSDWTTGHGNGSDKAHGNADRVKLNHDEARNEKHRVDQNDDKHRSHDDSGQTDSEHNDQSCTKDEDSNDHGDTQSDPVDQPSCVADNILFVGTQADELIFGACGDDELYGARGNDIIFGGAGADYLSGNWGSDVLTGGAGADIFAFDGDFDDDIVTDFSAADGDTLVFSFYTPDQIAMTAEMLLDLCVQDGNNTRLSLPGTNEQVILQDTDHATLTLDQIKVMVYDTQADFIA
ncbi:calcium-binding protein [Loktanella sp. M215]|uniref:calcium-binding protein n=1 Tax=Loktanella sp. M215 TaxID=2675431 RepID=UPI0023513972|nr:calcium-binding protein [Loktanella sp. M215]